MTDTETATGKSVTGEAEKSREKGKRHTQREENITSGEKEREEGEGKIWAKETLKMSYGRQERDGIKGNRNTGRGFLGSEGTWLEI